MITWIERAKALRLAALCLVGVLLLGACTISGAGFLTSNSGGKAIEPYAYPPDPGGVGGGGSSGRGTITVYQGDTLYSVAMSNQIDLQALIDENGLVPPYDLTPGDVLRIPGPKFHEVLRGETIYSISKDYGVDALALASMNNLYAPYAIQVGDELRLPGGAKAKARPKKKSGWRLGSSGSRKKSKKSPVGKTTTSVARSTPRGGGRFLWPAHGTIISTFGSKGGGRRNDGINIAVQAESRVVAADDGTVTYVGNELRGYGNLILIRHRGNWVTAYAHNGRVWVEKDQAVTRGQHIANAGQTGDADRPQVHFELRRGPDSVDPLKYLNMK